MECEIQKLPKKVRTRQMPVCDCKYQNLPIIFKFKNYLLVIT